MVLSMALRTTRLEPSTPKKRAAGDSKSDKTKKGKATPSTDKPDPDAAQVNSEAVSEWKLPTGVQFLDLFNSKMPALKGWPVLTDTRISTKQSRAQRAPMCVRYQATGRCKRGCSLAHVSASDMPAEARSKADSLFKSAYAVA